MCFFNYFCFLLFLLFRNWRFSKFLTFLNSFNTFFILSHFNWLFCNINFFYSCIQLLFLLWDIFGLLFRFHLRFIFFLFFRFFILFLSYFLLLFNLASINYHTLILTKIMLCRFAIFTDKTLWFLRCFGLILFIFVFFLLRNLWTPLCNHSQSINQSLT